MTRLPQAPGVYVLVNAMNGKVYVGSSINVARRITIHRSQLNAGRHPNAHLQRAWIKYGAEAFTAKVLESCDAESIFVAEQRHIDAMNAADASHGYNGVPFAIPGRQPKSSAHRAAMSAAAQRRWALMSPATRESLLAKQRARTMPSWKRAELSAIKRSSASNSDRLRRMNEGRKGTPLTAAHREKLSAALRGRPHCAEHLAAIAAARRALVSASLVSALGA